MHALRRELDRAHRLLELLHLGYLTATVGGDDLEAHQGDVLFLGIRQCASELGEILDEIGPNGFLAHGPRQQFEGLGAGESVPILEKRVRKEKGVAGSLHIIEGGDHSYKLPAALRGKRIQELERACSVIVRFVEHVRKRR